MKQLGFFDFDIRLDRINKAGDPMVQLNDTVDWEIFRSTLDEARKKPKKSKAGSKGFDVILLFKILILQSLYNLADETLEFQILDRYSFSRFLGLHAASKVPDSTTIWRFRAQKGQIVDASIVKIPIQRNTRDENKQIKNGDQPEGWSESKQRQKDTDARWTRKNNKDFFGYKNHISVDVKYKFIRSYSVTSANVHDCNVFEELLDPKKTSKDVWADSVYCIPRYNRELAGQGLQGTPSTQRFS